MPDTLRTLADLQARFADNNTGEISPQDVRDALVSAHGGFGAYDDLVTKTTRLIGVGGTPFAYECDGAGVNTDTDHLPFPKIPTTDELWDTTNDKILLVNLPDGTNITVRLDFTIDPASPNTEVSLTAKFSNSSDVEIFTLGAFLTELKATGDIDLVVIVPFFVGAAIVNGFVRFDIECSNNSTVEIGGVFITVLR